MRWYDMGVLIDACAKSWRISRKLGKGKWLALNGLHGDGAKKDMGAQDVP